MYAVENLVEYGIRCGLRVGKRNRQAKDLAVDPAVAGLWNVVFHDDPDGDAVGFDRHERRFVLDRRRFVRIRAWRDQQSSIEKDRFGVKK